MPRFEERRTWKLLSDVPPNMFFLVREALSLRQRIVRLRQSIIFLQRCKKNNVLPRFVSRMRIGAACGISDQSPKIRNVYKSILDIVIKERQQQLYSSLLKCRSKEASCQRYLSVTVWKRIEKGSKTICDDIRSRVKASLCRKYDQISGVLGDRNADNQRDLTRNDRRIENVARNETAKKESLLSVTFVCLIKLMDF